jgi:hypothetical protein
VQVKNHSIDLVGIPNARVVSARSKQLLAGLVPESTVGSGRPWNLYRPIAAT